MKPLPLVPLRGDVAFVPLRGNLRRKTSVIGLLLAAFAIWPLLHHVVAKRYFVNPWRLFGWAMYCVPVYQPQVRFFTTRDGQLLEIAYPRVSSDNALAYDRFLRQRPQLGTLAEPGALGRVFFRQYPQLDQVTVQVTQPVYHYDTDRIREAYFEYGFERVRP